MLERCDLRFKLRLLDFCHVGDGGEDTLTDSQDQNTNGAIKFSTVQRDAKRNPVIEATSFRGSLREQLRRAGISAESVDRLLGPENVDETTKGESRLWVWAGYAVAWMDRDPETGWPAAPGSGQTVEDVKALLGDLPHADATKGSFVLAGNRVDRDSGAVNKGYLYHTEYLPAGLEFAFEGVYWGSRAEAEDDLKMVASVLASGEMKLGADKSYGSGRVELSGQLEIREVAYSVSEKQWIVEDRFQEMVDASTLSNSGERFELTLKCEGPFLINDPTRQKNLPNSNSTFDWLPLQRNEDEPVLSGKAVLQVLRQRAEKLELEDELVQNNFNYQAILTSSRKDPRDQMFNRPMKAEQLTRTQRLFGVGGWAGTLDIAKCELEEASRNRAVFQMIKLDSFTQAPMDGALVTVEAPFNLTHSVSLLLQTWRYENDEMQAQLDRDRQFIASLLEKAGSLGLKLGHASAAGFGWFNVVRGVAS